MQNQPSEIQSANSSEPMQQMFWEDLSNQKTTNPNESYFNKFKRLIPKYHLKPSDFMEPFSDGKTILENIAEEGRSDIIKDLFDNYDDINIDLQNNEGNTLMHIAVKNGNFDMAKFLIEKGARIELINNLSKIPLSLCPPENNEIKELLTKTKELDKELHEAIKNNNKEEIMSLLDRGARTNGGITDVESETVTKGNVKIGKFVSNIHLAIESDSSKEIMDLLMNNLSKDGTVSVEKKIPNFLYKSIQHGSADMVKYFLNDYDINYKYENEFKNNALQIAISLYHSKKGDEKTKYIGIINLLIDKIIEKYPQHEEILSCENKNGFSARFMIEHLGTLGENLLREIDAKIEGKKKEINQKEYEGKTIKLYDELANNQSGSNSRCVTALCCCMNVNVERVDVVGVRAELVFEDAKGNNAKTFQDETSKDQQPIAKPIEVQAPSNINSMSKISDISTVSIDSQRVNANSVGITLTSTPAVTPSKPSQGGGPRAMEPSSTMA